MVNVNPVNKNTSVNVSSSGTVSQIKTTTPQSYFDGLSKQWAISEDKVQGLDYSSKYYAQKAKENSQEAISALENVETVTTNAINQITTTKNETLDGIYEISGQTQQEITELKETLKADLENTKVNAIDEVVQNKTNALDEIENTSAKEQEELTKIKDEAIQAKDELVESGMFKFNLFDTKISDHIFEGNEAKGWALQGTYVSGALYPDFYNRCLDEKANAGEGVEYTLDGLTATFYNNPNGHQFYNISDKASVDAWFNKYGIADSYGIDEENERIFLPRNKYFAIKNPSFSVPVVGNGKTLGVTNGVDTGAFVANVGSWGATYPVKGVENTAPQASGTLGAYFQGNLGVTTDPTKSGVIANTSDVIQPDESKYLYYCVGNTVVNDTEIDAGGLVAQMEQKANIFLDNVAPRIDFASVLNTAGIRTIVETYQNGASWYRVWSDGWCEQGGRTASSVVAPQTITFLKSFKDLNYNSLAGIGGTGNSIGNSYVITTLHKTTTSMIIENYNSSTGANNYYEWEAKGFIK